MSATNTTSVLERAGRDEATSTNQVVNDTSATNESARKPLFTGTCFCKAITFTLSSIPDKSYLCHCLDCRQITGTSFAHNILFPFSSLTITPRAAEDDLEALSTKADVDRVLSTFGDVKNGRIQFCRNCGSRLFLFPPAGADGKLDSIVVTAGSIDGSHEDERLKPTEEGFCKRREAWMPDMRGTKGFDAW